MPLPLTVTISRQVASNGFSPMGSKAKFTQSKRLPIFFLNSRFISAYAGLDRDCIAQKSRIIGEDEKIK